MNNCPYACIGLSCDSMKRLYPSPSACAIILLTLLSLLTACVPKSGIQSTPHDKKHIENQSKLVAPPQNSKQIMALLQLAEDGDMETALTELTHLSSEAPSPLKEEAAFRRVQLLLKIHALTAVDETHQLLHLYPNHALAPYAHFWLAQWWNEQSNGIDGSPTDEYNKQVFQELTAALKHPRLTQALAKEALSMGKNKDLNILDEHDKIDWLLAAAHIDTAQENDFLRLAASNISLAYLQTLHQNHVISPTQDRLLYLHFARLQLMEGNMENLQAVSTLLANDAPQLPITRTIKAWQSGDTQDVYIGVLLPLTGKYARFGQEALNGIRMAMDKKNNNLHLWIEDTGSGNDAVIEGYNRLTQHGVDWVIGPLLSSHTKALLPYLKNNLPVISLSKENSLAEGSPSLFIHNIAKNTQAAFMAHYAFEQGLRRMAIIYGTHASESSEAEAFSSAFTTLGGEISSKVLLDSQGIDYRAKLHKLREDSDDEMLLESLLSERALFSPETELEIHMPPGIDGLYIATSGKQVAQLSGQLAYVDIRNIPILGSSRWMDGHLLDDRGRNLSSARFIQSTTGKAISPTLLSGYRDVWGQGKPSKLFTTAYDSTRMITLLGGHLGLHGHHAIEGLHDTDGFPGESGHVKFDAFGVGQKTFHLFRIQHKKLVPAG